MPADSAEIGFYPMPTIVELQIQQSISIDPVPGITGGGGLAIAGTTCGGGDAIVWVPAPGGLPPAFAGCALWGLGAGHATSWTDTIQVKQHAFVRHNSYDGGGCPTCYTYNGNTSATLRRLDYNFVISAAPYTGGLFYDSLSVNVGDSVQFNMLAQPNLVYFRNGSGYVSTASDPTEWKFVADDGEVLTGCPLYFNVNACARVMTKSGTMHLMGYVNGALKAELRAIHVKVSPVVPKMSVTCAFPGATTRGSQVNCVAKVTPDSFAFQIFQRAATRQLPVGIDSATANIDTAQSFYSNPTLINVAARQSYSWSGPAVTSTTLSVSATVTTATGPVTVSDSTKFVPTNRGWGRMSWNETASLRKDDSLTFGADRAGGYLAKRFKTLPVREGGGQYDGGLLSSASA